MLIHQKDMDIKENLMISASKEIFLNSGSSIPQENLDKILELDIKTLSIVDVDPINFS